MAKAYDFDVTVICLHDECNKQFKEIAVNELLKLSKYFSHIIDGSIRFDRQDSSIRVEVLLRVPGLTITATNEDYDDRKALNKCINKAKARLKKLKNKVVDHRGVHKKEGIEEYLLKEADNSE